MFQGRKNIAVSGARLSLAFYARGIMTKAGMRGKSVYYVLSEPFSSIHWPVPVDSPSSGGDVVVYVKDINQPSLPTPFLFCSWVCFCLYSLFSRISFHNSPDTSLLS